MILEVFIRYFFIDCPKPVRFYHIKTGQVLPHKVEEVNLFDPFRVLGVTLIRDKVLCLEKPYPKSARKGKILVNDKICRSKLNFTKNYRLIHKKDYMLLPVLLKIFFDIKYI